MEESISFRAAGQSIGDLATFETTSQSILQSEELEFAYRKLGSERRKYAGCSPLHLACIDNQWYLFAADLGRGGDIADLRPDADERAARRRASDLSSPTEVLPRRAPGGEFRGVCIAPTGRRAAAFRRVRGTTDPGAGVARVATRSSRWRTAAWSCRCTWGCRRSWSDGSWVGASTSRCWRRRRCGRGSGRSRDGWRGSTPEKEGQGDWR